MSHHARGVNEEPENFEIEVTMDGRWQRSRSVVSLKLLASSSSFILWLRMLDFMLKNGYSAVEKRGELISFLTHLSHIFH